MWVLGGFFCFEVEGQRVLDRGLGRLRVGGLRDGFEVGVGF